MATKGHSLPMAAVDGDDNGIAPKVGVRQLRHCPHRHRFAAAVGMRQSASISGIHHGIIPRNRPSGDEECMAT